MIDEDYTFNPDAPIYVEQPELIKPPVYSNWKCQLLFWTWVPEEGKVPSWLHRKLQTLLLGAKWEKIK